MKYIFDFDDVLLENDSKFKRHMYLCLEDFGVPQGAPESYYKEMRGRQFLPKKFISDLFTDTGINVNIEVAYNKILSEIKFYLNVEMLKIIKKLGKNNCYLVTQGYEEFQWDKIDKSNIKDLFCEVFVVPESKKVVIENICSKNRAEEVVFVDDRQKFFDELDFKKCPNLKTILYDKNGFDKFKTEIEINTY